MVSYRLFIVTIALSVTIRPQFAIECLRRSKSGGGSLWAQISGCFPWCRPVMLGSAASERPRLTITVKLFSNNSKLCDHNPPTSQTERRTDRQTTCDRKTALCTIVHRAVINTGTAFVSLCRRRFNRDTVFISRTRYFQICTISVKILPN